MRKRRGREKKKMMTQQQYFDVDHDHDDVDDDHHVNDDHVQVPPPCQNKFFSLSSFSLDENKLEPCQRYSSLFSRSRRTGRNKNDDTAAVL